MLRVERNVDGQESDACLPHHQNYLGGFTKHEDHIVGKGYPSMTHYTLVRKFVPMPQAVNILDAKAAVDKE